MHLSCNWKSAAELYVRLIPTSWWCRVPVSETLETCSSFIPPTNRFEWYYRQTSGIEFECDKYGMLTQNENSEEIDLFQCDFFSSFDFQHSLPSIFFQSNLLTEFKGYKSNKVKVKLCECECEYRTIRTNHSLSPLSLQNINQFQPCSIYLEQFFFLSPHRLIRIEARSQTIDKQWNSMNYSVGSKER